MKKIRITFSFVKLSKEEKTGSLKDLMVHCGRSGRSSSMVREDISRQGVKKIARQRVKVRILRPPPSLLN